MSGVMSNVTCEIDFDLKRLIVFASNKSLKLGFVQEDSRNNNEPTLYTNGNFYPLSFNDLAIIMDCWNAMMEQIAEKNEKEG